MLPPSRQRTEPPQPMKSAAPSSYLEEDREGRLISWVDFRKIEMYCKCKVLTSGHKTLGQKTQLLFDVHKVNTPTANRDLRTQGRRQLNEVSGKHCHANTALRHTLHSYHKE